MPHYGTWHGFKSDLTVKNRQAVKSLPKQTIYSWSPTKQIDAIRSWLEYGPGKAVFQKKIDGVKPSSNSNCVISIADELGINVKNNSFGSALKKYDWKKPPYITIGVFDGVIERKL